MSTIIIGKEREPFRYFDIAFLGYNAKLTDYGLMKFVDDNQEQVRALYRNEKVIILNDGTKIRGLLSIDERMRGYRFDQLILFDDERWQIYYHRSEDIRVIKALTMQLSNVPEEFQILKYEDIR